MGFQWRGPVLKEMVQYVDQCGSLASSVVYAGGFGAVLASIEAVKTHMVVVAEAFGRVGGGCV
ncbi:hypothetical protein [Hymenobacter sp. 102]|uniref:hypothetical protein n=1 Tax=Hymenobacter sp. 102 TaxID=3403152 RepID=UPI003CF20041